MTSSERFDGKVLFATGVADGDRAAAVAAPLDAPVGLSCEAARKATSPLSYDASSLTRSLLVASGEATAVLA